MKYGISFFVYAMIFQFIGFLTYKSLGCSKEHTIAILVCLVGATIMAELNDIQPKE
jgi:hypothetical protein